MSTESEKDNYEAPYDENEDLEQEMSAEEKERLAEIRKRDERRRRNMIRRRKQLIRRCIILGAALALLLLIVILISSIRGHSAKKKAEKAESAAAALAESALSAEQAAESVPETPAAVEDALAEASLAAAQYDYDKALARIQEVPNYEQYAGLKEEYDRIAAEKETLVEYPLDKITHIFYHSLLVEPEKAFDGDGKDADYNQAYTTVEEYNKITQTLYDKGYVLVSVHDMAEVDENGVMQPKKIMLPPGKTPFVLSQDDVSYYHYMDGDGFATKLIIDSDGKIRNEYVNDDGSVTIGDYDMVPLLDRFVEEHPDFSYHGRKGILAMTGYDGVLGYRVDTAYKTLENLDEDQKKWLEANPDFDFDKECEEAKRVADAMKAEGWEFASHTWGHRDAGRCTAEQLQVDNEKWQERIAPILGKTDVIIFAYGSDISETEEYSWDNPKFEYFKSQGFDYYCPVNSWEYTVSITDDYFHQGRRNVDGYRMYYNPDRLDDLFNVDEVFDPARPVPVPEME